MTLLVLSQIFNFNLANYLLFYCILLKLHDTVGSPFLAIRSCMQEDCVIFLNKGELLFISVKGEEGNILLQLLFCDQFDLIHCSKRNMLMPVVPWGD